MVRHEALVFRMEVKDRAPIQIPRRSRDLHVCGIG